MYHIGNDKRAQNSADEIGKGLQQLLKGKPLSEVTISDIHRETGISRATFYRLFDTPEDVLHYLCRKHIQKLISYYETNAIADIHDLVRASIRISAQDHELMEILVKNHRTELLNQMYEESFPEMVNQISSLKGLDEVTYEYIQPMLYSTMSIAFATWIRRGKKESPEALFEYTKLYGLVLNQILGP